MRLEQSLVLNRYLHGLLDARDLTELKQPLDKQEGRAADSQSYFYGALLGRTQDAVVACHACVRTIFQAKLRHQGRCPNRQLTKWVVGRVPSRGDILGKSADAR